MILLFEGVDKSGKSSLLNDFCQYLISQQINFDEFKNKIKPEGKSELSIGRTAGIYLGAYQLASNKYYPVLFDRSHITEVVYSSRRGYEALDYFDWLSYEEKQKDMLLVYTSAPVSVVKKRFEQDGEDYVKPEEIETILNRFDIYLKRTKLPTLKLSSIDDRTNNVSELINFLKEHGYFRN